KTVVVVADRANYPLPPSMWDTLLRPRIPKVTLGPPQTINLDVGASFGISVTLFGEPYDDVTQNFIVLDPATATVLFEGDTARVGPGSYEARLTAAQTQTLVPGAYEIRVITVGADAAPPVIIKQSFLAFTVAGVLETLIKDTETALRTDLGTVTSRLDDVDTANTALASDVAGLSTLVTVVLVLAVVAIATSAITALVLIRRIPPST
ncbi:MAG: hypothetical protein GTO63_23025, partial [Anaerolineae bacterium]|nr:hypothetical protein [Anaerolineae bacterium]NIN97626.1 hypothetical protein [Anaerolineae bacterium]